MELKYDVRISEADNINTEDTQDKYACFLDINPKKWTNFVSLGLRHA